jgi:hypothetical protein
VTRDEDLLRELSEAVSSVEEALEEWTRTGSAPPDYGVRTRRWERAAEAANPVIGKTLAALPGDFAEAFADGDIEHAERAADILAKLNGLLRRLGGEDDETPAG